MFIPIHRIQINYNTKIRQEIVLNFKENVVDCPTNENDIEHTVQ